MSDAVVVTVLAACGCASIVIDVRTRRVPNVLTFGLAAAGLALSALHLSGVGVWSALGGLALGLVLMLPGHVIGATGAGDVKLMAAVGAVVGPDLALRAFLYSAVAGGVFAIVVATRRGVLATTLQDTTRLVTAPAAARQTIESSGRANRFAYGPAIAVGTLFSVMVTL